MADVDVQDGPNPFLTALKQYKGSKMIPSSPEQTSGAVNPFADLIKKKSQDASVSPNGSDLSDNGSSSSQSSPNELHNIGGKLVDNNLLPIGTSTISLTGIKDPHANAINIAQQNRQNPPPITQPPNPDRSIMDKVGQALYLPAIKQGFNDLIVNPAAGATDFIDRTIDKAYQGITGEKTPDWLRQKGLFNDVSKQIQHEYDTRDKPTNAISEIAEGAIGTLPLMASMYTGEGEASLAMKAPQLFGKLAKTLAVTKGLTAYKDATDNHEDYLQSLDKATTGAVKGGIEGQFMDAQMLVGGALGKGVANKLAEKGLLKGGKSGQAILHALSVGTVFGGTSAGDDLLSGKDINTDEALKQFSTGLAFEMIPTAQGIHQELSDRAEGKSINIQAAQVAAVANSASNMNGESAFRTLIHTTPDQIQQIHDNITKGYQDLYADSIEQGAKAYDTKDINEKRNLYTQQLALKAQGDIKMIADKVKKDPTEIIQSINDNTEISPEQKTDLLSKINILSGIKTEDATTVEPPATPVERAPTEQQISPREQGVNDLQQQKEDFINKLKTPIKPQENESNDEKNNDNSQKESGSQEIDKSSEANAEKLADEKGNVVNSGADKTVPETIKVRIPHPEYQDIRQETIDKHGENTPENLAKEANTKTWYHGSNKDLTNEHVSSAAFTRPDSLLGLGFYMTDNPEIAEKYANLRRNKSSSTVNEFNLKTSKILDAEKPIDKDVADLYKNTFQSLFDGGKEESDEFFDNIKKEKPNASLMDYHKAIREHIADSEMTTNDVTEHFQDLESGLKDELGYDGISHIGGIQTGGKNHNVMILLDPSGEYSEMRKPFTKKGLYEPKYQNETDNSAKPIENNDTANDTTGAGDNGSKIESPESAVQSKPIVETKVEEEKATSKIKVDKYELIQPSKLKGSDYHLVLGQHSDGTYGIIDKNTGIDISTPKESKWEAINAYEKNRERLTPKILDDAIAKSKKASLDVPDETPKKPLVNLSEKGKLSIDKDIEHTGITYDQIKDYEQSRTKPTTGLPTTDAKEPGRIQEDVRPSDEQSGSKDENPEREAVREQPEKSTGELKEEKLRQKVEDTKASFMKAVRETRKKGYSNPLDPELIAQGIKLMKAYADLGIHKFSEIAKDFISSFGKDEFTDENEDALKAAYMGHVANLDPKERKTYNTLKEVDAFMGDGMKVLRGKEPKATIPTYTRSEPRLPLPTEETDKEAPKLKDKYSKISALKSYSLRNLEQLKAFSKDIKDFDAYREVRKYATSKSQASVILKTATQKILKLIGKDGWETLRKTLVESRLRGLKDRWNTYADQVKNYSDEQVKSMFNEGEEGNMSDLVKNLSPLEGENNPQKFAVSLIASGRLDEARTYLENVFKKAADNVLSLGEISPGKSFDDLVTDGKLNDPKMQQALDAYKEFIEKPIAESHESNEGIFSDSLGDLDTYYPLTGENSNKNARVIAKGKPYNEPSNINNKFATGQSDNYSIKIADLSDKLTGAIKTNNKANAIEALKNIGLITEVAHNAPETEKMQVGDDLYDFVKEKVADSRTIINDGNIVNTKSKYVMMPTWLKSELDPIFNSTDQYDKYSALGKVMNTLTKVSLGGPTEAIAHSFRMLGVITNSMPFMQEWAYKDGILNKSGGYVANNTFVKKWTAAYKVFNTDISSDKALQTIQEMSKLGIIPEKTWTKTWSREFAELAGAKASRINVGNVDIPNIFDFSPILYGKKSVDLKARVTMYNLVKAMNPEATPEQHVKMQNELGVYTKALQSSVERKIKESGLAPYYTFGTSVYRTALKTVFGSSPLPLDRPSPKEMFTTKMGANKAAKFATYKAAQLLTNGIVGSAASWMLIYHAQTGKWPWEDETSKLGRIPFPEWAKNDLTAKYFTDGNGDYKDINMLAINNPIAERGLRVTGAEKAYETNQLGGTLGQNIEAGGTQALNTVLSPFTSSPALQAATTLTAGSAPYITSLRDDKGKPSPQLYKKVKATPFGSQPLANGYSVLKEVNPLIDAGLTQVNKHIFPYEKSIFGLNSVTNSDVNNEGASALGFVLNMAFPRFFVAHGNDDAKAHFIEKAQTDLDKTIEKEKGQEPDN